MSKEGKSDAPMLKIKKGWRREKSAGRDNICSSTKRDT